MSKKIYVEATNAWRRYQSKFLESDGLVDELLAENPVYGVQISIYGTSPIGATIEVASDDMIVHTENVSAIDCYEVTQRIYEDYLSGARLIDDDKECGSEAELSQLDEIDQRELEMDMAVEDLLTVFAPDVDFYEAETEILEKLKDMVCEFLWRDVGISVYRPMFLEDENGSVSYEEYPYEDLIGDE